VTAYRKAEIPAGWSGAAERGSSSLLGIMLWTALHLGAGFSSLLLLPISSWFLATSPASRAASRDYLTRALGRPAGLFDVARHFHSFACAILDRVFLLTGRTGGFSIETTGLEHLTSILGRGRGCVLMGAHLGSFEVLRTLSRHSPVPVWALMFRRNAGALTGLLDRLSPSLRDSIIEIGDTTSMLQVREALERGEIVGILADRTPPGHRQVVVPFLGSPAGFPAGPFILAATLGVPVVLFHGVRIGRRRYAIRFTPFADRLVLRRASRSADLTKAVGRYARAVELGCRAYPFNWFNFFPFWEPAAYGQDDPPVRDAGGDAGAAAARRPGR
jgi:predicted LPLAT superfamily acyltransferase